MSHSEQKDITVQHRRLTLDAAFEAFTAAFEKLLGRFSEAPLGDATPPDRAAAAIRAMEGEQGLMLFQTLDHGTALALVGVKRRARQYLVGNPLVAASMSRHDVRAALYAPLRVLVYDGEAGRAVVEFDQASSLFGQFGNGDVTAVARALDEKLDRLIEKAAKLAAS
jgi:uncharacterized protein (DUF302 family)